MTDAPSPDEPAPPARDYLAEAEPLAAEMLAEVGNEIVRADEKASLLIGSLGIAFSIVLGGMLQSGWSPEVLGPVPVVLWIIGTVLAAAALFLASMAVWPRFGAPTRTGPVTYWGNIGRGSPAKVAEAISTRGVPRPERTFQQLIVLSGLVRRKYVHIRWSMVLTGLAIVPIVISFML